jgi:hypothetical protein
LADADVVSGSGAFDLLVSALQLETTTPTTFGGTLPLNTYFVTLSPAIPSTGSIMFNINAADTGGAISLFLSLFLDVHAGSLTGPVVNFGGLNLATSASWITTPLAGNLIVMGGDTDTVPVQSQELNANLHTGLDAGEYDFFLTQGFTLGNGGGFFDILQPAAAAPVAAAPEPSSLFLVLAMAAGLGWSRRIIRKFSYGPHDTEPEMPEGIQAQKALCALHDS